MRISAILLASLALTAAAQAPQPTPEVQVFHPSGPLPSYEVATIKKADQNATGPILAMPIGQRMVTSGPRGETIKSYIESAYSPSVFSQAQVVGGPAWLATDSYVIQGKPSDELRESMQKMTVEQQGDQTHMMQQSLLADRFKLKVHFEVREMPIYELTPAKGGLKIKEVPAPPASVPGGPPMLPPTAGGQPPPGMTLIMKKESATTVTARSTTMASLINILRRRLDSPKNPIVDKTGFTGNFDIADLEFSDLNTDSDAPSLVTALQEKLGLKLVATKGPVEVVVIDSIERPSEN